MPIPSLHTLSLTPLLVIVLACITCTTACVAPFMGDTCETATQCDQQSNAICDTTIPNGYCTLANCVPNGCPNESVCVIFDDSTSRCMRFCESSATCRTDLVCRPLQENLQYEDTLKTYEDGAPGFCYLPRP